MLYHWDYKLFLEWEWSRSRDFFFKFYEISDNNPKTVQDRRIEAICALSNGYVADDFE